jgi:hypothetical protein
MTLQEAIDFASVHADTDEFGIDVAATISMHDDVGDVLVGSAFGLSSMFRRDLPLLNFGTATIAHGGATATTGRGSFFTAGPAPGFSTRGLGPGDGAGAGMGVIVTSSGVGIGTSIPIDFSVRKDPGTPWLRFLGRGGPSVQIEIEKRSAPSPGGTAISGVKIDATENGGLLRGVGPSLQDAARSASYTVTIVTFTRAG